MDEKTAREAAVRVLEAKGFRVRDISSGQGVPRFSRLEIAKEGRKRTCLVKCTTGGRISFTRDDDGTYRVLRDADYVLHVQRVSNDPNVVAITMFNATDVVAAFEENHESLEARGMSHIPSWVNPEFEEGWRLKGSGFGKKALWSELSPLNPSITSAREEIPAAETAESWTIAEAKLRLARSFGVPPESIEITIRG